MKNIKLIVMGAALLLTSISFSQSIVNTQSSNNQISNGTPQSRATAHTNAMTQLLNLTPSQISDVSQLNLKVEQKIETIKTGTFSQEKKEEFIAGNLSDKIKVLSVILTETQLEKYKASDLVK